MTLTLTLTLTLTQVTYGDWEAAVKYNLVELALERLIHQAARSTSRPRTTVSVQDVLRRLSIVLDTLQVTCRRLVADFDSNHDGILDDDELVTLFTFLMPCLSPAECRSLLRTELPPLLPGGDPRGGGGGGGGQRKATQHSTRPLSLADFQQLLTLDCTTLVTQAEAAQSTSLVEDAVQALMLICANDSQTLQPDPLMLETLVPLLREPCGSRLQVYALTALWSLLRCFQRSAVPVPQLTKQLARSVTLTPTLTLTLSQSLPPPLTLTLPLPLTLTLTLPLTPRKGDE